MEEDYDDDYYDEDEDECDDEYYKGRCNCLSCIKERRIEKKRKIILLII